MTNTVTVRLRRPKAEVLRQAKPNLNAWINNLIDDALGPRTVDWEEQLSRREGGKPVRYACDKLRKLNR